MLEQGLNTMKKLHKFITSAVLLAAVSTNSVNADTCAPASYECAPAYSDSCCSSMTAIAPIAILVVAGVLIAVTGRSNHGSSSSSSSSSHSHSHSHSSSSSN